jgi:phage terminase large subunit-like protein
MMGLEGLDLDINLPRPHKKQIPFIVQKKKRKVVKAGRRGGKTVGVGILAVQEFNSGKRVLYGAPTTEQIARFWVTVNRSLQQLIDNKVLYKNETEHIIEYRGTENRIRAKTAWNADTLRGDYADVLILDEWQLMNEDAWIYVGAPMLLDNNGDAVFIYTPPSLHSRSITKASDPQHASKLYKKAKEDTTGRWGAYHFTSHDNPYISEEALSDITQDMTALSYRMEIMAEDIDQAPGALWQREDIDKNRCIKLPGELDRIVVGVDPSATSAGDEAGIVVAGKIGDNGFVLADESVQGSPLKWATAAVTAYHMHKADRIVAESNQGGEMVSQVISQVDASVPVTLVHASRGKATRAEPVAARYEQGRVHHFGQFPFLEDELCLWVPGDDSPNRLDALVWALTDLLLGAEAGAFVAGASPQRKIVTVQGIPASGIASFYGGQ